MYFNKMHNRSDYNQSHQYQMISDNQSDNASVRGRGVTTVFGLYFCNDCRNILTPIKANGHILELNCATCGPQTIDFSTRQNKECMLYSKQLQVGSKKYNADLAYIFDPTMPSVEVECPQCGYNRAVYFLTPDQGETKIVARMICASATGTTPKCGNIWNLEENSELLRSRVVTEDDVQFA